MYTGIEIYIVCIQVCIYIIIHILWNPRTIRGFTVDQSKRLCQQIQETDVGFLSKNLGDAAKTSVGGPFYHSKCPCCGHVFLRSENVIVSI